MAEKLADMFNPSWFRLLAGQVKKCHPAFKEGDFFKFTQKGLAGKSLNERMRHATLGLKHFLPPDYAQCIAILSKVIVTMPRGYTNLVFPDFVGQFGEKHFGLSMEALEHFTKYGSSEFAIRQFLKADFDRTIEVMYSWAKAKDHHVRRLASEGSRPRLPWSAKLDRVLKEPALTRPILDELRNDPELYVRKSVANHLNDISKYDPHYMLSVCASWDRTDPRCAWVIRHASRTLIKKGHQGSLLALDFEKEPKFELLNVKWSPLKLKIGQKAGFSFQLRSQKKKSQKLAIDYRIHYAKKHGTSIKTFKLKECELKPGSLLDVAKQHSFVDLSTRRHYAGDHLFELQVNGRVVHKVPFRLLP